ncbi:MBL fold metallo-hydrolase [Acetobacterium woodii]|uniref:Metallo-hydrolase/oxidoreductase n=1 Tax=Acetobacterium woodii (strain ATCC 29683 / DSM 1030 / JCM 2381 / KCTC 1655 / WB1) TaxID=931626 RepID=H6LH50_ACEWD|nr:MBL fold metallo-hydrolase [Acetobacterium woodii]AFA48388.1 metallo-hydrolase/oxidoreductase [Acetobacterium woodii DSM 1030]
MRLKVVVDNNTYIDEYYWGEPGVSYYIEDGSDSLLFDVGYTNLFLINAEAMNIKLKKIASVILSHGHDDHTRGLISLFERDWDKPLQVIAHPDVFNYKEVERLKISAPYSRAEMETRCDLKLTREPMKVTKNIIFLGEIPRTQIFEKPEPIGQQWVRDKMEDDYLLDDSALVYQSDKGIYIITGCSHSGICNIIEYAKVVTGDQRICGVIGGFHLFDVTARVEQTIAYFVNNGIREIYPCHCTSFAVKAAFHQVIPVHEVGVGLTLDW